MPLILLFVGLVLVISAVRNTTGDLGALLAADLSAQQGGVTFATWAGAVGVVGALGYAPVLREPSRWLMALVFLVIVLETKGGLFTKLQTELQGIPKAPAAQPTVPLNLPDIPVKSSDSSSSSSSGGGSGGSTGQIVDTALSVAKIAVL